MLSIECQLSGYLLSLFNGGRTDTPFAHGPLSIQSGCVCLPLAAITDGPVLVLDFAIGKKRVFRCIVDFFAGMAWQLRKVRRGRCHSKVVVTKRFTSSDALCWIKREQLLQQIESIGSRCGKDSIEWVAGVLLQGHKCWQLLVSRPVLFRWSAQHLAHHGYLLNLALTSKKGDSKQQLAHDTPHRPHVNCRRIVLGAKKEFQWSIP